MLSNLRQHLVDVQIRPQRPAENPVLAEGSYTYDRFFHIPALDRGPC
jgi:hypothetical protein